MSAERAIPSLRAPTKPEPGVHCPIQCGLCCTDGRASCPRLTPAGCSFPRETRPQGCVLYLCGVARAVLDGAIDLAYGVYLKEWDRDVEKHRTAIE